MFRKYFENKRKQRLEKMIAQLPYLTDSELKQWYSYADVESMLGGVYQCEREFLEKIEEELNKRGFEHMKDY